MRKTAAIIAAAVLFLTACGAPAKMHKSRAEMTQREKDSIIAESGLPGSGVVKKAMRMSDTQERIQAQADSAAKEN